MRRSPSSNASLKEQVVPVSEETAGHLERMISKRNVNVNGDYVARRLLVTESVDYRSAFAKAITEHQPAWTPEEVTALNMYRAAEQSLTNESGGYGVPILVDPTAIITSGGGAAPLLDVGRIEQITTNVWKGVSTDGVAFAAEAENDAIAAQQATFAQPSITCEKAAAFIPFSFEIQGDYPGFAGEMARIIETAWVDYLGAELATGTAGLVGIFTAIDQSAGSEVAVTTDGALGPVDAVKAWNELPERARSRATWFSSVSVESKLRQSSDFGGLYTVPLSSGGIQPLLGRPYLTSDYAPAFSGTTGASNLAIVGDFSRFVIAMRVGMNIELVPHVFDTNGVPKGQRGYLAWARAGSDSVSDGDFVLLQNQ